MPVYEFKCGACEKTFSKILTIAEHEDAKIKCPACGSENIEQCWAPSTPSAERRASRYGAPVIRGEPYEIRSRIRKHDNPEPTTGTDPSATRPLRSRAGMICCSSSSSAESSTRAPDQY
jgi:putative FmdB family regulatory protein